MKAFGVTATVTGMEIIPIPVGKLCLSCGEPILDGEQGYVMPYLKDASCTEEAQHRECLLRSAVGSVGHQMGTCSCHGGDTEDPVGMTKREAAKAAVAHYEKKNK